MYDKITQTDSLDSRSVLKHLMGFEAFLWLRVDLSDALSEAGKAECSDVMKLQVNSQRVLTIYQTKMSCSLLLYNWTLSPGCRDECDLNLININISF